LDEAIAAYKEAIRLKPDYAQAHCNLGAAREMKGAFAESLAAYRRGHELGSTSACRRRRTLLTWCKNKCRRPG